MEVDRGSSGPSLFRPFSVRVGAPLFHAAWILAFGIATTHWIWLRPSFLLIALALVALLCGLAAFRAQRIVWIPAGFLFCLLGAWCAEMQPQPAPEPSIAALSDGLLRTVEGNITDAGALRSEAEGNAEESDSVATTQRIDVRVASIELVSDTEDRQQFAQGGVRLTAHWPDGASIHSGFRCGDRIRADARLLPPQIYRDPGAWNRRDYLLDQGITSTATVNADRIEVIDTSGEQALHCRISGWQHAASARILGLPAAMRNLPSPLRLSDQDAIMLAAMVTGDRTYLTHSMRVGFERTGSFHMLVVSGLHVAIVAGFVFWIARKLRLSQIPCTLITVAASFAYALFTGFATPVQRSLWMVVLYLLGRLVYRERNALNTIGFASLCLLAANPRSLFESSLQMTLLAVISIGGVAAPLLEGTIHPYLSAARDLRLVAVDAKLAPKIAQFRVLLRMYAIAISKATGKRIGWRLFPWLVRATLRSTEALIVSVIVEFAMTLPMAVYFHRITVLALPVNVLILPLLVVLVPAALVTLVVLLLSAHAALIPGALTAILLHAGVWLVHLFGSMALGDFRIPAPLFWQIAMFCGLLGGSIASARWSLVDNARWGRRVALAAIAGAAIAVVLPRPIDHPHDAMLVEAIDVGQGDSLLLISPQGRTMLVDGGGFGGGPRQAQPDFDIGEEVVSPLLWSRGIRRLDVVALSHAHSDHMGGLPAVLRNFQPGELWVGNNPQVPAYDALLKEARELSVHVRSLRAGDSAAFGSARVEVLAPLPDYQPGAEPANNDSLVLHVSSGNVSVLLEGDAESPIERAMLPEPNLPSTLLKVGHHGSTTSTQPEFLARVSPRWAVISCGLRNHYGHPRPEVLGALQAAHVRTFSTDINGASCFELADTGVRASAFCGLPGQ